VFCENKSKIGERKVKRFIVFFAIDEKSFFKYLKNVFQSVVLMISFVV
jgi:hypothetical protein